ncbi:MAG: biosynthetic-type acetolactate synthase large subunit [Armatimonadota bacterium]|nr:biosynthetic-type acetolactate synthase large subunit [Armatimonadota bacterium]
MPEVSVMAKSTPTTKMKGAQALIEALRREGVEVVFGHPGGASLPLYDALYDVPEILHVLVRHEQVAAHAAKGYAVASGKVGVCMATSGPGATNLVTGIADAYMDSTAVVAITGQVPTAVIGRDAFQEADVTGITLPITKHNFLIRRAEEIPEVIRKAFYLARTGRPGPVLVDVPRDLQQVEMEFTFPEEISIRGYRPVTEGNVNQIANAARAIASSRKPILYIGGGVIISNASPEVRELAERTRIPVTYTLMAKGAFPDDHPLCLGMLGMHGTAYANYAINTSDLIIAVGARFDDRVTGRLKDFAPEATIIHIDIDPAEIGKNKPAHIPIVGDAKRVLQVLLEMVQPPQDIEPWHKQIEEWRRKYPLRYRQSSDIPKPQFVIDLLSRAWGGRAVVTTDVGQHQMWAAQFFLCREPRTFITSGGLGAMGFGFPAAMGAWFARPNKPVVAILGDGGFQMTIQDLATAVEWKMPLKLFIINNGSLGMVRQWQELFYHRRYSHVWLKNPDFARVAASFGAEGISVRHPEEVEPAIFRAMEIEDRPVVVDCHVDPEENCFPMIPSGQSVKEMILDLD